MHFDTWGTTQILPYFKQVSWRYNHSGKILAKVAVIVNKAKKPYKIFLSGGGSILLHCLHLFKHRTLLILPNHSAKIRHGCLGKLTLGLIDSEKCLGQAIEQSPNLPNMRISWVTANHHIVQIDRALHQPWDSHVQTLECCRCIPESEAHDCILVQPRQSNESWDFTCMCREWDMPIPPQQIKFTHKLSRTHLIYAVLHVQQMKRIRLSDVVYFAAVIAKTWSFIWFCNKQTGNAQLEEEGTAM